LSAIPKSFNAAANQRKAQLFRPLASKSTTPASVKDPVSCPRQAVRFPDLEREYDRTLPKFVAELARTRERERRKIARHLRPDVVILDAGMPLLNGVETPSQIHSQVPRARIVVLSVHSARHFALATLRPGRDIGVGDISKPEPDIHGGTKYMRQWFDRYSKDADFDEQNRPLFDFASYNAGPARIARIRDEATNHGLNENKWFNNEEIVAAKRVGQETVQYVRNIFKYYKAYRLQLDAQAAQHGARQRVGPAQAAGP
jgi:hypothetical protein